MECRKVGEEEEETANIHKTHKKIHKKDKFIVPCVEALIRLGQVSLGNLAMKCLMAERTTNRTPNRHDKEMKCRRYLS